MSYYTNESWIRPVCPVSWTNPYDMTDLGLARVSSLAYAFNDHYQLCLPNAYPSKVPIHICLSYQ